MGYSGLPHWTAASMRGHRPTQEESAVEWELSHWGRGLRRQHSFDGYATINLFAQILCGRGSKIGHKVLCIDPQDDKFWEFNRNILKLNREFYEVLVARYAVPCRHDTGEPYRATDLARFLGLSISTYVERLNAARAGYRSIVFPAQIMRLTA